MSVEQGTTGACGRASDGCSHQLSAPGSPAERPRGTRIYWSCAYCRSKCAESRMACTFCFRERREATS